MKSITEIFPRASKSFVDANAKVFAKGTLGDVLLQQDNKNAVQPILKRSGRSVMNKTEAEYGLILEAQKRTGEIQRYDFEGITLRFAGVRYTPDFVVLDIFSTIRFIEIKGAYTKGKFERAVERFRHAKTYWPEFTFELHQKTKEGWKQII